MRTLFLILILLTLSCNPEPPKNFQNGAVEFVSVSKIPVIQGTLNGKKAYFIVDSGASISVLDENGSEDYNFTIRPTNSSAAGYGGVAQFNQAVGVDVQIGGVDFDGEYRTQDLTSIVTVIRQNEGITIVGIIGCDKMAETGLVIDFTTNSLYVGDYVSVVRK